MHVVLILLTSAVLVAGASLLAVYSYGQFARSTRGEPSHALPNEPAFTILDKGIARLADAEPGKSGLGIVSDNLDAFAIRALAARAAGRSLDLMYYYWKDDLTGRLLAHEIIKAADRGVRVRLLVDDINARGNDGAYRAIDAHDNIAVRLFNPSRARDRGLRRGLEMVLRVFSVTRRMHNKAWIADGRLAIVGGRNIGDAYFDADEAANFRDVDMALMGPVVQQVEKVFDAFWNSEVTMPIGALVRRRGMGLDALRHSLEATASGERAGPFLRQAMERISLMVMLDLAMPVRWTSDVRVVSDPPEKALNRGAENWVMATLMPVLAAAERSVEITSPYFVPGTAGATQLAAMVRQGVDVAVLTNSLAATDVAAVHGGYAPYRKQLLAAGVRLYELQPFLQRHHISLFGSRGASLHTKAFTVDDHTGFVGSFNFDPRSASLNTEMGVLFVEPGLVETLRGQFELETSPQMSYRVFLDEDGHIHWEGEDDGRLMKYDREPETRPARRLVAAIIAWLPIESQL